MANTWKVHLSAAHQSAEAIPFLPASPTRGWIKIVVKLRARYGANHAARHVYAGLLEKSVQATIRVDTGRGFDAEKDIAVTFTDGVAKAVAYIEHPVREFKLKIDPSDSWQDGEISVTPLSRWTVTWTSLQRNLALATGMQPGRRPSIWIGLKLLLSGSFRQFFRQLRVNSNPESVGENQYEIWMRTHERLDERIEKWSSRDAEANGVLFSIVILPSNSATHHQATIQSLRQQTYRGWEILTDTPLIISDEQIKQIGSDGTSLREYLQTVLAKASGDYLAFIPAGDQLAPHALSVLVETVEKHRNPELLYSDEDVLCPDGRRRDPFFKPDYSPEFLLGSMYIGQLALYRSDLLRQHAPFNENASDAWDYALALRISQHAKSIVHMPEILYHRGRENHRNRNADMQTVHAYLAAQTHSTEVTPSLYVLSHHVQFAVASKPLVSILMASACKSINLPHTRLQAGGPGYWALNSISSIRERATYKNLEIILLTPERITDELAVRFDSLGVVRLAYREPFNFSVAMNLAASHAAGEHLLLLNDDTEVIAPDFLERMLSFSQRFAIGAVGAKLLFADETIQHAGIILPDCSPGHPFHHQPAPSSGYHGSAQTHRNYLAVTAACMMTRRDVFEQLGGFDESFHMNYNDVDYCLRAVQKGYRVVYQPTAELYHHESMSKPPIQRSELRAFQKRWASIYPEDPFYHREFRPEFCDFVLRG